MSLKKLLYLIGHVIPIILLTVLTQVGGIVWLVALLLSRFMIRKFIRKSWGMAVRFVVFSGVYLLSTFVLIPPLASIWGRVPLPLSHASLQPLTFLTALLNRNYVRKELQNTALDLSGTMARKYPGTITLYLDAGFPFINGFPLLPHLSHNDGRKMDLAFYYRDAETGHPVNEAPSPIGYGICEEPQAGEESMSLYCSKRGFWQYSFLQTIVPQAAKQHFRLDEQRTRAALVNLATDSRVGKIFVEPHLKQRMKLTTYTKIRFQGCQAVRHDDHIHIQL